jgi:SPOR domain
MALLFACLIVAIAAAGCSSSGTTQSNGSMNPADSAASQGQQPSPQKSHRQRQSSPGNQQGFVTQEDTIEAEVVTHNQGTDRLKPPSKHSAKKKYYSVQLGAFRVLANADKEKKIAQQRYKKPVYQFFDKPIKMYRVTVGNFSKLNEGLKFLKLIQEAHPKEYKDAWVAEMRR